MTRTHFPLPALALAVAVAACGGNVVVDPAAHTTGTSTGNGAGSGHGGATTLPGTGASVGVGASPGIGGSSTGCIKPQPGNTVMSCGGTAAATTGGQLMCVFQYCQSNSPDTFEATCQGSSCVCTMNGMEICSCATTGVSDICSMGHDCCFNP
jgi:hypothetical protein